MTKQEIIKFIDARTIVMLSTIDNTGTPVMRALINIRNGNIAPHLVPLFKKDDRLLFITNTSSDKIGQIRKNPAASIYCYDDSFNGLLLTGHVKEIIDDATKDALWDDSWKMYYPDGKDGGDFSILEFTPEDYKFYKEFSVKKGSIKW
ncbi:MAG: pyridoxamine 5'-phosphate oxidase family protein [Alphaproteobacteria bacterium]|nr:pyridoxamine 5'-phosphate oxidase family protein [Alphaproteobacteria bacterium]